MSERGLRSAIALAALVGAGVAAYLTVVHYTHSTVVCVAGGGCETVQQSDYAELAGAPVAVIGLVGYGLLLASALLPGDEGRIGGFFLALVGFAFSAYLTYLELFVIDAICQWCVASAVLMTVVLVLASLRLRTGWVSPAPERREP